MRKLALFSGLLAAIGLLIFVDFVFAAPANMATPSVDVDPDIEDATAVAIGNDPPEETADYYAITSVDAYTSTGYYLLSVVGLDTTTPDDWDLLEDAVWLGNAVVRNEDDITFTAGIQGTITYTNMLEELPLSDGARAALGGGVYSPQSALSSADDSIFPWSPGTKMFFGSNGVHEGTYGLANDRAVDWVSGSTYGSDAASNMAYASQSGYITWTCHDTVSTGLVIGNFGYLHLVKNTNYANGQYVQRSQGLGPMIKGSHTLPCGGTDQLTTSYHLHWSFQPQEVYFQIEGWTLNIIDGCWRKGSSTICKLNYMWAHWGNVGDYPTSTPGPSSTPGGPTPTPGGGDTPYQPTFGSSFWDYLVHGIWQFAKFTANRLPNHTEINFVTTLLAAARTMLKVVFVLMKSSFDLTIAFVVAGLVIAGEGAWLAYGLGIAILKLIKLIPFL
jgi:hypothetical protein